MRKLQCDIHADRKFRSKWAGIGLLINTVFFGSFLFAYWYTDHIHHWTEGAWLTLLWSSGIVKALLSVILIINFFNLEVE